MFKRKSEIEKFNERNNFGLWSIKMQALLTTQGLAKALDHEDELLTIMKVAKRIDLMERANSTILLNLLDEILIEVADEKNVAAL
ncbi:hypothetical protein EUGRSUZ_C01549 [Eucalyptus grandis]|uniref:Uncharacterized protein n=2 Tax=Eucalyptus grandis TaxID=71139 RepID=A0ACC3LDY2_EUCGR|nr:hypothetical protein EUGRSUZ_C01549 [Eucalyptus grandis]